MQDNEEQSQGMRHKPTADDVAGEMSAPPRRAAIWGPRGESTPMTDSQMADRELRRLPLSQVDPDPKQPRSYFSPQGLEELKQSIKARGQLNPAFVRPHPEQRDRYML